ncbi:dimethylarginine dimethylaminohydrolase family protein [Streptomyces sp. NPDC059629]|uniref:dimethylarginine dimethylaminohydrolase family protein n=1 Tax=Streptomyces sp. NPDC059629 TaxID=3346889 RepID=UPI0036C13264
MTTKNSGSDRPATLGGPGWVGRAASHAQEVAEGALWARCGQRSETAPLRSVLLMRPPGSLGRVSSPNKQLMHAPVDLTAIRQETLAVRDAFEKCGVTVHLVDPGTDAPPNIVFARDLFFLAPDGAVVGRTASSQRAGEERHAALALAALGVPILRTVTGRATLEGADALWLTEDTVLVGTGFRTNEAGADMLAEVLRDYAVDVLRVPLGPGVQHLLGSMVPLDDGLAAVHSAAATPRLRGILRDAGYDLIELEPSEDLLGRRGMNLVTVAPRQVVMPARAPRVRRPLEAAGVAVTEVDVREYTKAAGGVACATGILARADASPA